MTPPVPSAEKPLPSCITKRVEILAALDRQRAAALILYRDRSPRAKDALLKLAIEYEKARLHYSAERLRAMAGVHTEKRKRNLFSRQTEERIIELIRKNNGMNRVELCMELSISTGTLNRWIRNLLTSGTIVSKRQPGGIACKYVLTENEK